MGEINGNLYFSFFVCGSGGNVRSGTQVQQKWRSSILGSPSMGNINGSAAGRRNYRCFIRAVDRKPLSRHPFQCRGDGAGGREYLFWIWSPRSITPFIEKGGAAECCNIKQGYKHACANTCRPINYPHRRTSQNALTWQVQGALNQLIRPTRI